jgi:hypothetical protein
MYLQLYPQLLQPRRLPRSLPSSLSRRRPFLALSVSEALQALSDLRERRAVRVTARRSPSHRHRYCRNSRRWAQAARGPRIRHSFTTVTVVTDPTPGLGLRVTSRSFNLKFGEPECLRRRAGDSESGECLRAGDSGECLQAGVRDSLADSDNSALASVGRGRRRPRRRPPPAPSPAVPVPWAGDCDPGPVVSKTR